MLPAMRHTCIKARGGEKPPWKHLICLRRETKSTKQMENFIAGTDFFFVFFFFPISSIISLCFKFILSHFGEGPTSIRLMQSIIQIIKSHLWKCVGEQWNTKQPNNNETQQTLLLFTLEKVRSDTKGISCQNNFHSSCCVFFIVS